MKSIATGLIASQLLLACNLFHSSPKDDRSIISASDGIHCQSNIRQSIKNFVAGSAKTSEISASLGCVDQYIERFKNFAKPTSADGTYSFEEVDSFFKQFFSDTKEFNTPSLKEYFRIKNLALGGDEKHLTKADLTNLQSFLKESSPILGDMSRYISIYTLKASLNLEEPRDAKTLDESILVLHRLESLFQKYFAGGSGAQYKFANVNNIEVLNSGNEQVLSETESFQLVMSLKSILVHPPEDSIRGEDFKNFVSQLFLISEAGLRLKYTQDLKNWGGQTFLDNIQQMRESFILAIQNAFKSQDNNRIPNAELSKLISKLDHYRLLPFGLREQSIQNFMPVLMSKVLAPVPSPKIVPDLNLDFTAAHLNTLITALDEWLSIQKIFIGSLHSSSEVTAQDLIESFERDSSRLTDPKLSASLTAMKEILSNGIFLRWRNSDVLNFAPRSLSQKFTSYDLIYLSTSFSIIRGVLRGYIQDPVKRNARTLSEPELNDLYLTVRELGKDLKFIDTRNPLAPARAFLENNIFTSVSNGNDLVEFHEAMEWFYQVWSAGRVGLKIYNQVPENCKKAELDVFERKMLDHACYTAYFKDHVLDFFGHLPTVSKYLSNILNHRIDDSVSIASSAKRAAQELTRLFNLKHNLPPLAVIEPWIDFNTALENSFRSTGYSSYDYDSPDIEAMALIMSYTEALFTVHARNHTEALDSTDLWAAFPILKGFIERASNGAAKTEFIQKAAYSYLISFGELPDVDTLLGKMKFGAWSVVRYAFQEKAYVPDILKVLSSFNLSAAMKKLKDLEAYFEKNKANLQSNIIKKDAQTKTDLRSLFFCLEESRESFAQALSDHAATIFARDLTAHSFHSRIEEIIRNDKYLKLHCLAFE